MDRISTPFTLHNAEAEPAKVDQSALRAHALALIAERRAERARRARRLWLVLAAVVVVAVVVAVLL